jgi:hypothetical protein
MSNPARSSRPTHHHPSAGLILAAADHLIPLFQTLAVDTVHAHKMAVSAIAAYEPESRADFVNAARIIAFSMAALALLGKAASGDRTMPEQMRLYGRANTLNRSADQSERSMMVRRRDQRAHPPAEQPDWMNPSHEAPPEAPFQDAMLSAAVAEAVMARCVTTTPAQAAPTPPSGPAKTAVSDPKPAQPVPNPTQRPAATPGAAIRYSAPALGAPASPKPAYKAELLQNSAMPRVQDYRVA